MTGPIASISTPFLQKGEIDFAGLGNYIDFSIEAGAHMVLLTPGDSLFNVLAEYEIERITKHAADVIGNRAMFIASSGTWWTARAILMPQPEGG